VPRRREDGAREVLRRLPRGRRLAAWGLARLARRLLDLREDLRFFLDRVLFALRRALLELGAATGLADGVLYLTEAELRQVVAGDLSLEAAQERIARRRRELARSLVPPPFYVGGRPVETETPGAETLAGVGTSPGRASGRARIVSDPTRAAIAPGDVLVAANTDPGWTPVLGLVAALVVEEGGLLNHCSIVARELGVPAVVGVRQATRRIPEGALVTVDGGLGTVRLAAQAVLSRPGSQRARDARSRSRRGT
jgi:pyruvate,water dikinase